MKRVFAIILCLCLLVPCGALAEGTLPVGEVEAAPVDIEPVEEELALQPDAPEGDMAVSAAEVGEDLPKASRVRIDEANFPDGDFREYVSDEYDLDGDYWLSQEEINAATSLSIGYLSSIKGIRFLNRLEYVDLYQLDMGDKSIDLSGFASLKTLDINRCEYGSLNLSGCSSLERASLYRYGAPFGTVNLRGCAALEWLNIGMNGAMKVDISDCPRLIKAVKKGKKTDAVYGEEWVDYRPVTFQYKDYTLYCDVEADVVINGVNVTKPTSIKLNKTGTVKLKMTDTLKLKATMKPATAVTRLTWKSSETKIAKVSSSGKVTPVKPGTVTITVSTANGFSAKVKVRVEAVKPTQVKITKGSKASMYVGDRLTLKAKLTPGNATSRLTWESSDTKVATVSSSGVVKAKKKGTVKITVRTANERKDTIRITVKNKIDLAQYFYKDIHAVARKLGMTVRSVTMQNGSDPYDGEGTGYECENSDIRISTYTAGHKDIHAISLKRPSSYRIWGVGVGMEWEIAEQYLWDNMNMHNINDDTYDWDTPIQHIYTGVLDENDDYGYSSVWLQIAVEDGKVTRVNMFPGGA